MSFSPTNTINVFYDGGCPICCMEVDWYRRLDRSGAIVWTDILELRHDQLPDAKTREELLGKFHVLDDGGSWYVGVDAFGRIWRNLPVLNRFAFLFSLPVIRQIAELGYRGFLRWQRWHRARRHGKTAKTERQVESQQ